MEMSHEVPAPCLKHREGSEDAHARGLTPQTTVLLWNQQDSGPYLSHTGETEFKKSVEKMFFPFLWRLPRKVMPCIGKHRGSDWFLGKTAAFFHVTFLKLLPKSSWKSLRQTPHTLTWVSRLSFSFLRKITVLGVSQAVGEMSLWVELFQGVLQIWELGEAKLSLGDWGHLHSLKTWVHSSVIACCASICQTCTARLQGLAKQKPDLPGEKQVGVRKDAYLTWQQMLGMSLPAVQLQLCTQRTW